MTVLGVGFAPAGAYPCGHGVSTQAPAPILVPYPDPTTGLAQSGYQVNPATGDYLFTPDGRMVGCATVKALVEHACATLFNSSAVAGFGLQTPGGVKSTGYEQRVAAKLTASLAYLVKNNIIQIVRIKVTGMPNNVSGTVGVLTWRDLTAPPSNALNGGRSTSLQTTSF